MESNTKVKLRGRVTPGQLLKYLRRNYDMNAESQVIQKDMGLLGSLAIPFERNVKGAKKWKTEAGYINFHDDGREVSLFYMYSNIRFLDEEESLYYVSCGLPDFLSIETTDLSLQCCESNIEIGTSLAKYFGGWVDFNDCDEEAFVLIK